MTVFAVNYDLRAKAKPDYKGLEDELKRSSGWWHHLESTWLVCTEESARELYDRLAPHIHPVDTLLVIEVTENWVGWMTADAAKWLRNPISSHVY